MDKPRYIRGHAVTLAMVAVGTTIYGFLWFLFRSENKKRDEGVVPLTQGTLSDDELAELGDESYRYRYTI